jgi:hypothetical protein
MQLSAKENCVARQRRNRAKQTVLPKAVNGPGVQLETMAIN